MFVGNFRLLFMAFASNVKINWNFLYRENFTTCSILLTIFPKRSIIMKHIQMVVSQTGQYRGLLRYLNIYLKFLERF